MITPHPRTGKVSLRRFLLGSGMILLALVSIFGCAKLPMDNEAPGAPILESDGLSSPFGVSVRVLVDDPDGDMITLQFEASREGGISQAFNWTNFFASGEEEVFLLNLVPPGQWTLTARARDELDEMSPSTTLDLTVSVP